MINPFLFSQWETFESNIEVKNIPIHLYLKS